MTNFKDVKLHKIPLWSHQDLASQAPGVNPDGTTLAAWFKSFIKDKVEQNCWKLNLGTQTDREPNVLFNVSVINCLPAILNCQK